MKKVIGVLFLALVASATSFASDVVGHSVKVAGKDTAKAATYSTKEVGKAGLAVGKAIV